MTKARILVVEDEYLTNTDIRNTLIMQGFEVPGVADSGADAITRAGELMPDLVLMDIILKGKMNGIEAAGEIHQRYGIPVVFLTAHSDDATVEKALATEPFGYLVKPLDERTLKSTIQMALYKHEMEGTLFQNDQTITILLNATDDIQYLIDTEGKFLAVNEALAKKANTTTMNMQGTSVYDLVMKNIFTPRMVCWDLPPTVKHIIRFDEEIGDQWFEVKIVPVIDRKGKVVKYAGYIRDITKKKKIDEQMQQNEIYFRGLIDNASDIIVIFNPDGTFRKESPSLESALGISLSTLSGKNIFDVIHADDTGDAKKIIAEILLLQGMVKPFKLKFRRKGNSVCVIEGILSNLTKNPLIEGIVLNGWAHEMV